MGIEVREPSFWILTSLADGPKHGYAILANVSELSATRVKLKIPTLYAALDRLAKDGLIQADSDEVVDGRRRRYFSLTSKGKSVLVREIERMEYSANRARRNVFGEGGLRTT